MRNGVLYIPEWVRSDHDFIDSSGVSRPQYHIFHAVYNNQNDPLSIGTGGISDDDVVFTPVIDINTAALINGVFARYRIRNLKRLDYSSIECDFVFDDDVPEIGSPANGQFCLLSEVSPNLGIASPPIDDFYSEVIKGGTVASIINDLIFRLDKKIRGSDGTIITLTCDPVTKRVTTIDGQVPIISNKSVWINGIKYRLGVDFIKNIDGSLTWSSNDNMPAPTDDFYAE